MDKEALEVLRAIKGEMVKLRNDILMLRVAVENIEKEVKKPKEHTAQPHGLDKMFSNGAKIEKL